MLDVHGQPIIQYIIDFWAPIAERFVFVVKHAKEELIEYVQSLPLDATFAEPEALRGIADGLSVARPLVGERFVVVLGDCVCRGTFAFPRSMQQGVGVWPTDRLEDIQRSYSVEIAPETGLITRVEEKPKSPPNDLCGMGYYFFDSRVFDYIARTEPSALRNEVEITDVIGNMARAGEPVHAIPFSGDYLNVTHPEDLERAAKLLQPPGAP